MRTLTRREVAAFLRTSISTVRRMEGTKLHPERDEHGVHRFDIEEIKPLAASIPRMPTARGARDPGRLAARLFAMFDEGLTLVEIVDRTRQTPQVVRDHYREWRTSLEAGEEQRRADEADRKERERVNATNAEFESFMRGMRL